MAKLEYSGKSFGRPNPKPLTKSWRIKHGVLAPKAVSQFRAAAIAATLLGQDSVGVTAMSRGLAVYCGYEGGTLGYANGSYTTMPEVYSVFPGKLYVSVGRDAIDIEPGLASAGDGPGFVRGAKPPHTSKPTVYCSAGDLSAVIGVLSNAGIPRSSYWLWSAHWIGEHICGPNTCGYPQCDGTQYDSNNSFDSDVFSAYMFGPVTPPAPVFPVNVNATGDTVKAIQIYLNKWHGYLKPWPVGGLVEDGSYGPKTAAAVKLAEAYFKTAGDATGNQVSQALYNLLKAPLPKPNTPPPPPVCTPVRNVKVLAAGPTSFKIQWVSPVNSPVTVNGYEIAVSKGSKLGTQVASYPRHVAEIATGTYEEQYGSLEPATQYVAAVRAYGPNGGQASAWSEVTFTTAK